MRRISIFGATGSVGESAFDLLMRAGGAEAYHTVALTGGRNIARLAEMARALRAEIALTAYPELLPELRAALAGSGVEAAAGTEAIAEAGARPSDWALSAIVGAAGLRPGLEVIKRGGLLALANKETLVAAGQLVRDSAAASGARILPVDSEHSAIYQLVDGEKLESVEAITITASGGAFRDWPLEKLASASVAEASCHPNWSMGQRITIDSASMFNKALEVIEAREFFMIAPERVKVLIHPQSIIHAMVSFRDGGSVAHLGMPDMRHAIGYALNWPERRDLPVARLDLAELGGLSFRAPDEIRWPALRLAREVMAAGGAAGAVFNAAKEQALDDFLAGHIGFTGMAEVVEETLSRASALPGFGESPRDIEAVMGWDGEARRLAAAGREG
ncbi:1-deoxy-D-xylulose-5-phosphate reductoisomerase [Paracoccus aminophilus]|uniref:1-deoxy-D-xylulose 5-phosphate reductoisomerase n=1 Tax=Paracoccus aminophilus JCM 7686 TaxID=1367847 RepID=S5YC03_PARAH|nr:1-deoxy-D-xylulose-5-phosphate reductoisomerase [Paracoccus aminophilus]AGT08978.1 1-deoxy-D-xylulose-5-phosphate reductoisomerase [Paracoccus aminophilus JCM 7686]